MTDPVTDDPSRHRRRTVHRLGFVLTVAMVAVSVLLLPVIFRSIGNELFSRQDQILFNGITGEPLPLTPPQLTDATSDFVTISILDVDQSDSQVSIAISGNRRCPSAGCTTIAIDFYALDDNASQRRGVPPVQTVTLRPTDVMFSETIILPIRGRPNMYPFDSYDLWLGISATRTAPDGAVEEIGVRQFSDGARLNLQNLDNSLMMRQPVPIPPEQVHAPTDPYDFITVLSLQFREPTYLIVLSILLVLMISVSSGIAMTTRAYQDLVLGVGGIVLGVWGVRSVLAQSSSRGVTLLDLSLSTVILLLLLTFIVRSALYFRSKAELPSIRRKKQ